MAYIEQSTISGNIASGDGGVANKARPVTTGSTSTFSHSIVSGNMATGDGNEAWNNDAVNANDYKLFGYDRDAGLFGCPALPGATDIVPGAGVQVGDILKPQADNGGPTFTHALFPGSPALDVGNPLIPSPPEYDQRGPSFRRVVGDAVDIGAYEYSPSLVGGVTAPVDSLELLAPATGLLAAIVALATSGIALVKRRRN